MQNREQIRARNALAAANENISGKEGGEVVKKIPPHILNHGLLATGAYAYADDNYRKVFDLLAKHLADANIALVPRDCDNTERLLKHLSEQADSARLQLVTAEAMAWLNYARRFIKKKN